VDIRQEVDVEALQRAEQTSEGEQTTREEIEGTGEFAVIDPRGADDRAETAERQQPDGLGINLSLSNERGCACNQAKDEEGEKVMRATMGIMLTLCQRGGIIYLGLHRRPAVDGVHCQP
jgi:hypothetical protein